MTICLTGTSLLILDLSALPHTGLPSSKSQSHDLTLWQHAFISTLGRFPLKPFYLCHSTCSYLIVMGIVVLTMPPERTNLV